MKIVKMKNMCLCHPTDLAERAGEAVYVFLWFLSVHLGSDVQ